jgi:hypothetical protein
MSTTTNTVPLPCPRGLARDAVHAWGHLLAALGEDAKPPLVPLMTLAATWVGRSRQLERRLRRTPLDTPTYERLVQQSALASSKAAEMLGQIRLAVTPGALPLPPK